MADMSIQNEMRVLDTRDTSWYPSLTEEELKKLSIGKINKFKEDNALLTQDWVMEPKKKVKDIGFPVLIKAAGGGGGKGMKIVNKEEEFENLFLTAKLEAKKFFGNDEVYIEKFFQN